MHAPNAREAADSLHKVLTKNETRGLVSVEINDLPHRMPPSSSLVVVLSDRLGTPDSDKLPSEWMGYHVRHRVERSPERVGIGVFNPRGLKKLRIET